MKKNFHTQCYLLGRLKGRKLPGNEARFYVVCDVYWCLIYRRAVQCQLTVTISWEEAAALPAMDQNRMCVNLQLRSGRYYAGQAHLSPPRKEWEWEMGWHDRNVAKINFCQLYCECPRSITVYIVAHGDMTLKEYITFCCLLQVIESWARA